MKSQSFLLPKNKKLPDSSYFFANKRQRAFLLSRIYNAKQNEKYADLAQSFISIDSPDYSKNFWRNDSLHFPQETARILSKNCKAPTGNYKETIAANFTVIYFGENSQNNDDLPFAAAAAKEQSRIREFWQSKGETHNSTIDAPE